MVAVPTVAAHATAVSAERSAPVLADSRPAPLAIVPDRASPTKVTVACPGTLPPLSSVVASLFHGDAGGDLNGDGQTTALDISIWVCCFYTGGPC
jgi:hypothetical protein